MLLLARLSAELCVQEFERIPQALVYSLDGRTCKKIKPKWRRHPLMLKFGSKLESNLWMNSNQP